MIQLRDYQRDIKQKALEAWTALIKFVLLVLPTGAGKTVTFSDIIHDHNGYCCAIAHRQELVSQISTALARDEVRHNIIGPKSVIKLCVRLHMEATGKSYYDPNAKTAVAGVDTLIRRYDDLKEWCDKVTLWVMDEAHHVLKGNKWGKAVAMFPNAAGLGVTATPKRADGKGLGYDNDGFFQEMFVGPSMRDLINQGFLTDYRIVAPASDLVVADKPGNSGDWNPTQLKKAAKKSHIVGDTVENYLKFAKGKKTVVFATDVETSSDITEQFNVSGVRAATVSAKSSDTERSNVIKQFRDGKLDVLVNVDLFGEGFDLPAIECVIMARPTQSYALYVQQFGRALRLMDGKEWALIIDQVGNVERHGLPDAPQDWTLDRRERSGRSAPSDVIPVRTCLNPECLAVYERIHKTCPFCNHTPVPAGRSKPEQVDGDLIELDPFVLAQMRGEIERIDMTPEQRRSELIAKHAPQVGVNAGVKRHEERQQAQKALRESIAWWGAYQRVLDRDDSESYKRFYFMFGIDVMTAQTLGSKEALELATKINYKLGELQYGS